MFLLNEVYIMENENVKENVEKEVNEGKVENFVWQDKYNVSAKSISEGRICTITDEDVGKVVEVPYIVKDLIPEHSVGIISGLPGAGKTWVALHLSYCIATGQKFLNKFDVISPGPVMYLSFEGSLDILKKRAKMIKTIDAPNCIIYNAAGKLLNDNVEAVEVNGQDKPDYPLLSEAIFKAKENKVKLIVIDTLRASLDGEENSSTDIAAYLRAVNEISVKSGTSLLILHHIGKNEVLDYTNIYQIARGSSALAASVDYAFGLKMVSDDENDNGENDIDENNTNMILYQAKNRNDKQLAPINIVMKEFNNKITFHSSFALSKIERRKEVVLRSIIDELVESIQKTKKIVMTDIVRKDHRVIRSKILDVLIGDNIVKKNDKFIYLNELDRNKLNKYIDDFNYSRLV